MSTVSAPAHAAHFILSKTVHTMFDNKSVLVVPFSGPLYSRGGDNTACYEEVARVAQKYSDPRQAAPDEKGVFRIGVNIGRLAGKDVMECAAIRTQVLKALHKAEIRMPYSNISDRCGCLIIGGMSIGALKDGIVIIDG